MSDEQAAPSSDGSAAPPQGDAAPANRPGTVRRWVGRISIGGLVLAVITVIAGLAEVSGFTLRDLARGGSTTATGSPPSGGAGTTLPGTLPGTTLPGTSIGSPPTSPFSSGPSPTGSPVLRPGGGTGPGVGKQPKTTQAPNTPPAPIPFQIKVPAELPMCADIGGDGTRPATGRVLIFVQHAGQSQYFYERPVDYPAHGRWVSYTVRLGEPHDTGQFYLHAVQVDQPKADRIVETCVGVPCPYDGRPPGRILASSGPVNRTASTGSCSA